jgi:hypothetical protein
MARLPAVNQPAHHPGALLHHLARRMPLRAEPALAPLGLRPRRLVALTVLRDRGGSTQQALAATLEMDGTKRMSGQTSGALASLRVLRYCGCHDCGV